MASNVSIATRPLVYSTFRYINNKVWNALAEYIDNNPEYDMAKIYYDYSYQCLSYYNKMQAIQEALGQGEFSDELYGVVIRYDGTK